MKLSSCHLLHGFVGRSQRGREQCPPYQISGLSQELSGSSWTGKNRENPPVFQPGCAKVWKHQTRRSFYSSENHGHLKHFHSCCSSPGKLCISALPRSGMNFQGVALLWLSGVRWNSSAALLVAFPSLFQLSSKNRNSPDPALPPVHISNPSEAGNASPESD